MSHLCKDLIHTGENDRTHGRGFLNKISEGIKKISKKIKAALILKEGVVLIDTHLHPSKKAFGQGHELGHHQIPEHKAILYVCSEADLDPRTRIEMEFEANVYSSEILIPSPLLEKVYKEYPLSMETILMLANFSGASIHASALKYVSSCTHRCCLLILEADQDDEGKPGLRMKQQIWSPAWGKEYRRKIIGDKQFFPHTHNLSIVAFSGQSGDVIKNTITIRNTDKSFNAHTFFNGYTAFALLL